MVYFTKSHWLKYPSFCVYFRKKNQTSTCFSKETFKLLLLQVTALYIKYTKDTMNTQYKSRLLSYDEHYIDSTELSSVLTLFRMSFFGAAHRWGATKICHTYPPMMRIGTFIPYLKKNPLSSADISIFLLENSKFCYIKKYRYRFHLDT